MNDMDDENLFAQLDALYTGIIASIKPKHLPNIVTALSFALPMILLILRWLEQGYESTWPTCGAFSSGLTNLETNSKSLSYMLLLLITFCLEDVQVNTTGWREAHTNIVIYLAESSGVQHFRITSLVLISLLARKIVLPSVMKKQALTAFCVNAWRCATEVIRSAGNWFEIVPLFNLRADAPTAFLNVNSYERGCGPGPHGRMTEITGPSQGIHFSDIWYLWCVCQDLQASS